MSQGLSSGCSEKHSPHTLGFTISDCAGDELQVSIHKWFLHIHSGFIIALVYADWHGSLELRDHLLNKFDDLEIVLELVDVLLHLIDSLALLGDKLLVVLDVLLNSIEEQMHGFLLLRLNRGNVLGESFNIRRLVDLDLVVLALLDQILDSPLCLVAELHPRCVGQRERILVLVQVDEVREVEVSERLDDTPSVVLWNCQSVQLHQFRSRHGRNES